MKDEKLKCSKCKKECEEVWQFGNWERFKKYWDRDYCESCFVKLFEKEK